MTRILAVRPGRVWRTLRVLTQSLALITLIAAPFLGGWQRLERNDLSAWKSPDTELPGSLRERLPRGETAGLAYEYNKLIGGGTGAELVNIPFGDPLAVVFVLTSSSPTGKALLAFAIPFLIALLAGRVFCGWFCPFGTLSRIVSSVLDFLPFRKRIAIPNRRPLRYAILILGMAFGLLGSHVALYLALPHLLLQATVYSAWLLGGGGATLGLLLGLIGAGVVMGPTTYCATLCPTGGALALAGHARVVRLGIAEPSKCGSACRLCSQACWIQLEPSSGDAGPDCDLCGRCVPACPRTNLHISVGRKPTGDKLRTKLPVVVALLSLALSTHASAQRQSPELVLAAERVVDGVTVAVDVVDRTGIPEAADSDVVLYGIGISLFFARGEMGVPDERGLVPERDRYTGPLSIVVHRGDETIEYLQDAPTHPISTQGRSIYRKHLDARLHPGDVVEVLAIEGWLSEPQRFEVPSPGVDTSVINVTIFALSGGLLFGGLLSLGLAIRPRTT